MDEVILPHGRQTTRLGFGCSGLVGGQHARASRRLVETALECGFCYFDVAPSYGHGLAEDVLGEVLGAAVPGVAVASKVGIGRPRNADFITSARNRLMPALHRVPWLRRTTTRLVRTASRPIGLFSPDYIRSMLDESRRRLKRDQLDIYLLHEIAPEQANDVLVEFMLSLRAAGEVGSIGTGTGRPETNILAARFPELTTVKQFSWTILDPPIRPATRDITITHQPIRRGLDTLRKLSASRPGLMEEAASRLGRDLSDQSDVADLLIALALAENQSGVVLVSSTRPDRIRRLASIANDETLKRDAVKLQHFLIEHLPATVHDPAAA